MCRTWIIIYFRGISKEFNMKHIFSTTLLLITLGLTFNSASAEVLYSYVGAGPLTEQVSCTLLAIGDGSGGAWVEDGDELEAANQLCTEALENRATKGTLRASFIVEDALTASTSLGSVNVLSWQITDGTTTLTNETADISLTCFLSACSDNSIHVATDENGNIIEWEFGVSVDSTDGLIVGDLTGMSTIRQATSEPIIIGGTSMDHSAYLAFDDGSGLDSSGQIISGAPTTNFGSAEAGTWTATVIPVPAAAWLFISALGLLGFRRKR
jgi:hypothetical protein